MHTDYKQRGQLGKLKSRFRLHEKKAGPLSTHNLYCCNNLLTRCARTGCPKLVDKLLDKPAADLLQAWWTQQPCYKLFQKLVIGLKVNKLWVTNLIQLDKITALLQLVDKLVTSLLRTQLVDKIWDFYVCRAENKTVLSVSKTQFLKFSFDPNM